MTDGQKGFLGFARNDKIKNAMVTIPLYSLLVVYGIFLVVFVTFILANIMHIILTGSTTFASFIVTIFILLFSLVVLFGTWHYLQDTSWTDRLTIWNNDWLSSVFRTTF